MYEVHEHKYLGRFGWKFVKTSRHKYWVAAWLKTMRIGGTTRIIKIAC